DRSLIGNHTSQVQPFDDMASEQSSLEMVFQGVVAQLSWREAIHAGPGPSSAKKITLDVSLPKLKEFEFIFSLSSPETGELLFDYTIRKTYDSAPSTIDKKTQGGGFGNNEKDMLEETSPKDRYGWKISQDYENSTLGSLVILKIVLKTPSSENYQSGDALLLEFGND
ncbi:hypothetical protein KGQ96_01940, partial [Halomonas coralii]